MVDDVKSPTTDDVSWICHQVLSASLPRIPMVGAILFDVIIIVLLTLGVWHCSFTNETNSAEQTKPSVVTLREERRC